MAGGDISSGLSGWTSYNLQNCIGVDECMKACPVAPGAMTIGELNEATRPDTPFTPDTLKFAAECIQCGRCDAVCPAQAGRSVMMLSLKEKMSRLGKAPESHTKYFRLKGHDKSFLHRAAFNAMMKAKWAISAKDKARSEKLAPHIDKDDFSKAEHLLYFGCYIFTGGPSALHTVEIAERLGLDFEVLGGLKSCCGWPQLLGGRTGEAEDYHERLSTLIAKSSPSYVVTGCAECFMALLRVKQTHGASFTPLTTPMWLNMFEDKLKLEKLDEKVTFHDSCNISRKVGAPEPARRLLGEMNPITEMERSGPVGAFCCGYWGLKSNPDQLKAIHKERLEEARGTGAGTMVVECVSCLESFSSGEGNPDVKVVDIVSMVHERMGKG